MKSKKKNLLFKNIVTFILALCMVVAMNVTVFAAEDASPAVADAREGVLQINLVYEDQSGNEYVIETGSGFLIGASSGATTVITNHHVVSLDDNQKAECTERFGVDFSNANNINLKVDVVVKRDVVISASYVNGSEKTDFAILELSQAIYDRKPLKLANDNSVVETQRVFALGFPWTTSVVADEQVYTSEDVTITNGIVGKFQEISEIGYILHDAGLGYGNSGGPLVNSNGDVVGVNTMYTGDGAANYYYSIAIDEIADVLDALGIVYESASASAVEPEPTTSVEPEPIAPVEPEPTTPIETVPAPTTEQPIQEVVAQPANNMGIIIAIVAIVVVLVIAVVIIVVVTSSKKKNTRTVMPGTMPTPPVGGMTPPTPPVARPIPPAGGNPMPFDSGAGETSVLGGGAGETSVLSANMQPAATLIRKKNGESATITKSLFTIGKERARVDFCIPDNNSISRNHANIICKGGIYYIVDKNSTNFTFVNGNKITANQEMKLNSGDRIRLADEEFEFRL